MMLLCAGDNHNLDLNLGMSSPSFGNGQKESKGGIQFHPGPYDLHSRKLLGVINPVPYAEIFRT